MARDKRVPASYRIALGQIKRYFGDSTPTKKDLDKTAITIAKKNKLDDAEFFMRWVETQIPFSMEKGKPIEEVKNKKGKSKARFTMFDIIDDKGTLFSHENADTIEKKLNTNKFNKINTLKVIRHNEDGVEDVTHLFIKDKNLDEVKDFYRLDDTKIIKNDLYTLSKENLFKSIYDSVSKGDDFDMERWNTLKSVMAKIENSVTKNKTQD